MNTKAEAALSAADRSLVDGVLGAASPGQRRAIAKTITLLESTRAADRDRAEQVLALLAPRSGGAFRIGISGVPGVGKSSFIEALGLYLIGQGQRVAVLAVDPSSSVSGGSILGDKTRMERLSVRPEAFIRPSPSGGNLGGVAARTREALLVLEAAGYGIVIVETVGVGQSEAAVAGMTDLFVLMQLPNAGDELQAIKRGVMELADLVLVNKSDLDPAAAMRARAQITSSLRITEGHGRTDRRRLPEVLSCSALSGAGLEDFWRAAREFRDARRASGALDARRSEQNQAWMWERIEALLHERFHADARVAAALPQLQAEVRAGRLAASLAARRLIDLMN